MFASSLFSVLQFRRILFFLGRIWNHEGNRRDRGVDGEAIIRVT